LLGVVADYEKFHKVKYKAEVLDSIVGLTDRYIADKNFPDKAIDILDECGALAKRRRKKSVTRNMLLEVISRIARVPLTDLGQSEVKDILDLEKNLKRNIIGQDKAIGVVADSILRARAGIKDANRPLASFLFLGATGQGKTLLAKELAQNIFVVCV